MDYPNPFDIHSVLTYYRMELALALKLSLKRLIRNESHSISKRMNSRRGQAALVLANGPSLREFTDAGGIDFFVSRNVDIFGVNHILYSDVIEKIERFHFVLSDPAYFSEEKLYSEDLLRRISMYSHLVFVPKAMEHVIRDGFGRHGIDYECFNDRQGSAVFSNSIDPTRPRSYASMTAYKALAIAIYLGYERIYIIGFDNTYIQDVQCDRENRLTRVSRHFDSKAYKNDGKALALAREQRRMYQELLGGTRLFLDLDRFRNTASRIYNLNPDSLVDSFEKITFQEIETLQA